MQRQTQNIERRKRALQRALADVVRCQRESDLVAETGAIAAEIAGAHSVRLLTRDESRPPSHPMLRFLGRKDEAAVDPAPPAARTLMAEGEPTVFGDGGFRAVGLALPDGAESAALLPCSGEDSRTALCLFWEKAEAAEAADLGQLGILAAMAGATLERIDALRRERTVLVELESRIRKIVALIRSITVRSADRASSVEDFLLHFEGRLDAFARTQVALARAASDRTSFEAMLLEELLAQSIQEGRRVTLHGMNVVLGRQQIEVVGMAVHELAVNAVKYGPFSGRGGTLAVRWWLENGESGMVFRFEWRERCELPVALPVDDIGFGRTLIDRALPYELDAKTSLEIGPLTAICRISVPMTPERRTG